MLRLLSFPARVRLVVMAAVAVCLMGRALHAQQTTGNVRGVVRDSQDAVVPNAAIELLNVETGVAVRLTSGPAGAYAFNLVSPGAYVLTVNAQGFSPTTITNIIVEVSRTTTLDVKLEAGPLKETVEVTATRPRIDTSSAQVSTNVERREIEALPSFDRSVLSLVEMAPGVDFQEGDTAGGQVLDISGVGASVSGNRGGRNGFYLDGVDNTGAFRNQGLNFPNPDTVQEVQVATSNTSAEFGKQPGGSFNVVTKSGTNRLSGTGAYFFRHKSLNANTWASVQTMSGAISRGRWAARFAGTRCSSSDRSWTSATTRRGSRTARACRRMRWRAAIFRVCRCNCWIRRRARRCLAIRFRAGCSIPWRSSSWSSSRAWARTTSAISGPSNGRSATGKRW
jgi:hypothetical protein